MPPRSVLAAIVATSALLGGGPAHAQDAETPPTGDERTAAEAAADALFEQAMARYEASDLAGALEALEAAYARAPRPDFLFAMGRIHVERGDCVAAIDAYRRFLLREPGPQSTQIATDAIANCQRVLAASGAQDEVIGAPAPAEPAKDDSEPVEPPPPAVVTRTRVRAWYTDPLGVSLVGAGAASGLAAGALLLSARADVARADEGGAGGVSFEEYQRLADRADRKQRWAGLVGGVGAALVVGGVLRIVLGDRDETVIVAQDGAGGASAHVGWRF